MQFSRLAALVVFFLSFGFLVSATPIAKEGRELEARTAPDAAAIAIGATLLANVKADVAVITGLLAGGALDAAAFADVFVLINAHINVAVGALVDLNVNAYLSLNIVALVTVYANVFLVLFPVFAQLLLAIPACGSLYFPTIDLALTALLNVLLSSFIGVLVVLGPLIVSIFVFLQANAVLFVNLYAILGPVLAIL